MAIWSLTPFSLFPHVQQTTPERMSVFSCQLGIGRVVVGFVIVLSFCFWRFVG